ncbi:biotin/lipoyl-containing protein [Mesoaciditoga sp.]
MGKKYLIKVNGKMYEVEVEELGASQSVEVPVNNSSISQASATTTVNSVPQQSTNTAPSSNSTPSQPQPPEQAQPNTSTSNTEGEKVTAPMSGVILKVNVKAGDEVKDAQTLIVIEAMKMENEILAPRDGKIKEVLVKEGDQVEIDQTLIIME